MNSRDRLAWWRKNEPEPDHRTEAVLAKLDAAVRKFETAKKRVDRAVVEGDRHER